MLCWGGGGSTMGYKLAGYEVIGCNEIDLRMMGVYQANHKQKYGYLEAIQTFKLRKDLPAELYELDILDGSPPCSSFSIAGARDKYWGKKKHFREGQQEQVLDTLFFDFIDLAKELRPKVVIAENVKGLLIGDAIKYVAKVYEEMESAGYYVQHFLLNGADMGLPQRRERVFVIGLRKDLAEPFLYQYDFFRMRPRIDMVFSYPHIPLGEVADFEGPEIPEGVMRDLWRLRQLGDTCQGDTALREYGKERGFNQQYGYLDSICPTITSKRSCVMHFNEPRYLSTSELCKVTSFPGDYDFCGQSPYYICGMSVPPLMIKRVATEVYNQWLSKLEQ